MLDGIENIQSPAPHKKNSDLFIEGVVTFNQGMHWGESHSRIVNGILDIYLTLPEISSAALFSLDEKTFEFYLSDFLSDDDEQSRETQELNIQKHFDQCVDSGTVAEALDKGHIANNIINDSSKAYLIPVISPAGILGIIVLISNKVSNALPANILNYCFLHANQMAYLLFNSKLNKQINNLEGELEQKISARIEKIKQSSREIKLILDSILTGVFIIERTSGKILDVNYAASKLIGIPKEDIIGTQWGEWHSPKISKLPNISNYDEQFTEEGILVTGSNDKIPILRTFSNLLIGNRDIYIESFIDIEERKNSEEELKLQSNLLKGVAEASNSLLTKSNFNDAINKAIEFLGKAADVDRVYIYENSYEEESGELFADIKYFWANKNALPLNRLFKHFSFDQQFKDWKEKLEYRGALHSITSRLEGSQKEILLKTGVKSFLIVPIIVENRFWGFIGFDDCTTERIWTQAEESILKVTATSIGGAIQRYKSKLQLIEAKDKADRSDKLKSEFLAQISHEIRTPINTILSFTSILKDEFEEQLSEDLDTAFDVIANAGSRITRTVELILNISEINTGIYDYVPVEIKFLEEILKPVYNEFARSAKNKNISFDINYNYNDLKIIADKYSVMQIFTNLVDNAVKFTESGGVSINAEKSDKKLEIKISDTGIGISNDYLNELYSVFSQEDHGYTRKYEGNGLGLALVKKYCDMNNFDLKMESQKDEGSSFTVTIPI